MKNNKLLQRIISLVVCLTVLLSCLPVMALAAEGDNPHYNRVADANTLNGWQKYFDLNNLNTANAGGVWTDKSVLTDATALNNSGIVMLDNDRNFLTALSALAANKEVVGYSTVPTDTVLILDVSGSMNQDEGDLVTATNNAITQLLSINKNNRVGVVLYSAANNNNSSSYSQSVTRLLPLGRYTTRNNAYLVASNNTVSVNDNVRVEGQTQNPNFNASKSVVGGTYIQAGLWEAWKIFSEVPDDDIYIADNNWQKGEHRMPIVVLMSDGAPTVGTSQFDDVENSGYTVNNRRYSGSNAGNGSETNMTAGQGFLVQLTAAYVKNRIENKYKVKSADGAGRSLFYTLGFNISYDNDDTVEPGDIAYSVLNPDASTVTDTLWSTYNARNSMQVRVKSINTGNANSFSNVTVYKNSYASSKSYVDKYFAASAQNGLSDAFKDIVDEIILQSRYYPTHLEGGNPDFSGYVEFTDQLGEYMEVKQVNGILLGNTLFDGHMMASKLADTGENGLGTPTNPTALGDAFIASVKTRLGIADTVDAQLLVKAAYDAGQLHYAVGQNGKVTWSNYIGWYAKADGTYLGHWNEASTAAAPAGAVYKMMSYGFLGETNGSIKNSDMMYMTVQVRTDIATGVQTVSWKIPAALVPMVTYKITLTGTNVDEATNVSVAVEDPNVSPIRLVYETGLRADLNEFNITRITDGAHLAADGHTRLFWNNYFDISAPTHDEHITALAEFTPNKENERFYFTFDSAVFKKTGQDQYALVTQAEGLTEGGEYYHRRYIFKDGETTPVFFYEKMSAASVKAAIDNGWQANFETLDKQNTGAWVVPKGTPARELQMYDEQKAVNATNSAKMVFHPYLTEQNNTVYVDMNLGNNGLLSVAPATGIQISKTVDIFEDGTSDTFKFRVTANVSGSYDSWITALDQTPNGQPTSANFVNGVYEVELKKDQSLWLIGLPAGTEYTVEEISTNDDYKVKSVHVNGTATGKAAVGTVAQYYVDDVRFVNTAMGEGDLVITKQVVDAQGNTVDVNDSLQFTLEVALTDAADNPVSGTFAATGGTVTVPANGKFTVRLTDGKSFILRGIPEETRYTVTETNIPAGFSFNAADSRVSGVIDATANDQALVVNTYAPTATNGADVSVLVTKQISGNRTHWLNGESYTFVLESLNIGRATGTVLATKTISAADAEKRFTYALTAQQYTTAGTYYYRITEQIGTQGGVAYDTAERRFSVVVADEGMDGDLDIIAVNNELNTAVSGNWLVSANFNNVYTPAGTASVTIPIIKQMNGDHALSGYQFALYDADPAVGDANELLKSGITNAAGTVAITLSYSAQDVGNTYTYYLAEIHRGEIINNIKYAETVYKVEVTVTDDLDGTISAEILMHGIPQGYTGPVFVNEYVPSASDFVTISGNKVISGDRVLNANEFSFVLSAVTAGAPLPAETRVQNAQNGSFAFGAIEFGDAHKGNTYVYTVTEENNGIGGFAYDGTVYTVTVTVADNGNQTITATATLHNGTANVENMVFTNVYDATDAQLTLQGTKLLTGKTLQADEFTFVLRPITAGAPVPTSLTAKNDAKGGFTFGKINYAKVGTYVYEITEQNGGIANYDYDESVYTVTVTVTDNSQGVLSAEVELKKNGLASGEILFRNGFVPTPITYDIYADFGGDKALTGRPMQAGEFSFALINAASGQQIGEPVQNNAGGQFRFPAVTLTNAGIYHYKIVEKSGDANGVTYDNSSFHIRLEVVQDDSGVLSIADKQLHKGTVTKQEVGGVLTEVTSYQNITANGAIVFNNTYTAAAAQVAFTATKTLVGRDLADGEFKFDLHKTDATYAYNQSTLVQDDVALALQADGTGKIDFAAERFAQAGTYHYVIVEDELDEKGITADRTEYKVEVTVTDDLNGQLVATLKVNGNALTGNMADTLQFNNTYKAATTHIEISGTKVLEGRTLAAEEFAFELYDSNNVKLQTVKNALGGGFAFAGIAVDAAGEYLYTVREVQGNAKGITYDTAVYTVKAVVTDNLDGTFRVEYTYQKGTQSVGGVSFTNKYTAPIPDPVPMPDDRENPKTGDNASFALWLALLFVSGGALLGTSLKGKKRPAEEI